MQKHNGKNFSMGSIVLFVIVSCEPDHIFIIFEHRLKKSIKNILHLLNFESIYFVKILHNNF